MRTLSLSLVLWVSTLGLQARGDEPSASDRPVQAQLVPCAAVAPVAVQVSPKPLTQRWYFWAAVGTVAASVVAVSVAASARAAASHVNAAEVCGGSGCDSCVGMSCAAAR